MNFSSPSGTQWPQWFQQIQNRHYFGLGLPTRNRKLLLFTPWWNKFVKIERNPKALIAHWSTLLEEPVKLLTDVTGYLSQLNMFRSLKPEQRMNLIEVTQAHMVPLIEEWYYQYRHNGGMPESSFRADKITLACEALRHLVQAYAILFQLYFHLPNWRYVKVQHHIPLLAIRILELIWLLQHLHALRYLPLPQPYLRVANQLYFNLRGVVDLQGNHTLLTQRALAVNPTTSEKGGNVSSSIEELYQMIQLFSLIDLYGWSTRHLHLIGSQVRLAPPRLRWIEAGSEPPSPHALYLSEEHDQPPVAVKKENPPVEGLLLEPDPLLERLASDLQSSRELLRRRENGTPVSPLLSLFDDQERCAVLEQMHNEITSPTPLEWDANRCEDADFLYIYLTFPQCYQFLRDSANCTPEQFKEKNGMLLLFAQGPSILSEHEDKEEAAGPSKWKINLRMSAAQVLCLRLKESDRSRPMNMGDLVAFSDQETGLMKLKLGGIRHIHRNNNNLTDLRIEVLGECIRSAFMEREGGGSQRQIILFKDKEGREYVAFLRHPLFREGSEIRIDGYFAPFILGKPTPLGGITMVHTLEKKT